MWRRDQAGNAEERNASKPVTLRYDPEAPKLSLAPVNANDPTLLARPGDRSAVGRRLGPDRDLARQGTGTWQTLATKLAGERLEARVDDSALPPGRYLLRASALDRAGNTGVTDKRADGSVATIDLPLRLEANLSAGVVGNRTIRRVVRRKGKRRVVRRKVTVLREKARARLRTGGAITGRLLTRDGRALADSPVYVFSTGADGVSATPAPQPRTPLGVIATWCAPARTRQLRLFYLGAPSVRPAIRAVELEVPARTGFGVSDRRLLNGQRVTFRGTPGGAADGYRGREAGRAADEAQRPVADVPHAPHRCAGSLELHLPVPANARADPIPIPRSPAAEAATRSGLESRSRSALRSGAADAQAPHFRERHFGAGALHRARRDVLRGSDDRDEADQEQLGAVGGRSQRSDHQPGREARLPGWKGD